jgi:hypothetical protein
MSGSAPGFRTKVCQFVKSGSNLKYQQAGPDVIDVTTVLQVYDI